MCIGPVRAIIVLWNVHCFGGIFEHPLEAELRLRFAGLQEQILLLLPLRVEVLVCPIHAPAVQFLLAFIR